jgi:hypothetical protein
MGKGNWELLYLMRAFSVDTVCMIECSSTQLGNLFLKLGSGPMAGFILVHKELSSLFFTVCLVDKKLSCIFMSLFIIYIYVYVCNFSGVAPIKIFYTVLYTQNSVVLLLIRNV